MCSAILGTPQAIHALAGHDASYVRAVWLVASAVGALALVVLVVLYRRLRSRADLEEAERILSEDS